MSEWTSRIAWQSENHLYTVIKYLDRLLAESSSKYVDVDLLKRTRDVAELALQAVERDIEAHYTREDAEGKYIAGE